MDDQAMPTKRSKSTSSLLEEFVSSTVLQQQDHWRAQYKASQPYPHCALPNLLDPTFLASVKNEIKDRSKVHFKESDLFRVYQSIDLANLHEKHELAPEMPHVMQLRRLLYSTEWRRWVEQLMQFDPDTLTDQVDCACNCHATGCHLLCHDDVIGTRKVSYILYLTEDQPRPWTAEEGGALELYDSVVPDWSNSQNGKHDGDRQALRVPLTTPTKTLLPVFNTMALFEVQPGISFHAVQEVLGDRPRLSLQGWYHAARPPDNMLAATLQRLKSVDSSNLDVDPLEETYVPFAVDHDTSVSATAKPEEPAPLPDSDRTYLAKYIHETYLSPQSMDNIRARFEEDSSVQLRNFFRTDNDSWASRLNHAMSKDDQVYIPVTDENGRENKKLHYDQGVSSSWSLVGPSHKQRFLQYTGTVVQDDPSSTGDILLHLRKRVLESAPFGRFLQSITSLGLPSASRGRIRRFRRGLDYTIAHHGLLTTESVLDATVCFVAGKGEEVVDPYVDEDGLDANDQNLEEDAQKQVEAAGGDEADVAWQSGDVGGFECYIAADDEIEEAADQYNQDDDTELLSVSACNNTLSLVYRDPGTMRFIKYLGAKAPSSRWDIAMEYQMTVKDDKDEKGCDEGEDEEEAE